MPMPQGRALARLHDVVLSQLTARGLRRLVEMLVSEPRRGRANGCGLSELAASVQDVASGLRLYSTGSGAAQHWPRHGDCHGYNATIDQERRCLTSTKQASAGSAYDLATFLLTCHIVSPETRRQSWASFLAGYRSLRTPRAADMDALEALVLVREIWTYGAWAEGAQHWGDRWFRSSHAKRRIEQLAERFERLIGPRLA